MGTRIAPVLLMVVVALALAGLTTSTRHTDGAPIANEPLSTTTVSTTSGNVDARHSFEFADLWPGWSRTETYTIENAGAAPERATLSATGLANNGGSFTAAERAVDPANQGDLGTHVHVVATSEGETVYDGTLEGFVAWGRLDLGVVPSGASDTVVIRFAVEPSTGNEIQGDSVGFELRLGVASAAPTQLVPSE